MSRTMTPGRAVTLLVAILVAVLLTIVYTLLSTMAEAGTPPFVVGSVLVLALALLWYGRRSSPNSAGTVRSTLDAPRPETKDDLE
ncbi:hypothetical protein [Halorarum salinum]|uniref:Uncharacterized protein n=1 Tax=Halorarum salinum TaxID=2743089 RepID=A0A7D5QBL0_9EURY|nr:hypothetical protein [Halobaculum salinum]QLG62319.1 hypothetical protein HUG12_11505 [Halobaculum salinum]